MTWREAMASAAEDTVCLILLDLSSSVQVGLGMFVDDTRTKVASQGYVEHVIGIQLNVSRRHRYRYTFGPGKSEITAIRFSCASHVVVPEGSLEYVHDHVSLGVAKVDAGDSERHLD